MMRAASGSLDSIGMWLGLVTGAAVVALLAWQFGSTSIVAAITHAHPQFLLAYFCFGWIVRLGYSLRWRLVARRLGESPTLSRLLAARLCGDAVGSLLPGGRLGGDPLRVALVYGDGLGGARAGAGVVMDRIFESLGNIVCGIVYVTVFSVAHTVGAPSDALAWVVGGLGVCFLALLLVIELLRRGFHFAEPLITLMARLPVPHLDKGLAAMRRIEEHLIEFVSGHPGTCVGALAGSLVVEALVIVEAWLLLSALGVHLDVPTLLMVLATGGLTRIVPTPGALGALEAGEVTVVSLATGRPDIGVVVGMAMRLHETLWCALGFGVLAARGVSLAQVRALAGADEAV